jgi:hypothetical protein
MGAIGGTVTVNGEARPIVWVELQVGGWQAAYGTTIPAGSWEWGKMLEYVVHQDAARIDLRRHKEVRDRTADQRTVVNFALAM